MEPKDAVLLELGRWLKAHAYAFTTPTPLTIQRVNSRAANAHATNLAGAFGWNRPFAEDLLPTDLLRLLQQSGVVERHSDGLHSTVRYSTIAGEIFVHSAYPTAAPDAVFFGPDTYRFVRLVKQTLIQRRYHPAHIIDVCCGSGAGALSVASMLPPSGIGGITLSDINEQALRFSSINAALSQIERAAVVRSDLFAELPKADLIIANPPYLVDAAERTYRHGGGTLGIDLAERIVREALSHLSPGGCLIVYTGTPVIAGTDCLRAALEPALQNLAVNYSYEELDPDVFGEELEQPAYVGVDRIALVAVIVEAI